MRSLIAPHSLPIVHERCHVRVSDFNYLKACQSIETIRIGKNWNEYNVSLSEVSRCDVVCLPATNIDRGHSLKHTLRMTQTDAMRTNTSGSSLTLTASSSFERLAVRVCVACCVLLRLLDEGAR